MEEVYVFAHVRLSVCEQDYSKTRAWIWMKCCVSTDVVTWTNWLSFETDPDYSPDAETRLLSPISYALQCRILLRWENLAYRCWVPVAALTCGFIMVLFTASRGNNFVGGTCAPPSALPVFCEFTWRSCFFSYYYQLVNLLDRSRKWRLRQGSKSNFGVVWPWRWPLTSWPQKSTMSCTWPVVHLCKNCIEIGSLFFNTSCSQVW